VILIVTNRGDYTADWLVLELERRRAKFVRFNTENYPTHTTIAWKPGGSAYLGDIPLDEVSSVWYRRPIAADPGAWSSPDRARWALGEAREALAGVWRTLDVFWVNHPENNRLASSKPEQLARAVSLGFSIPQTLVTNDSEVARDFVRSMADAAICKPLGDGRLEIEGGGGIFFTSRLDASSLDDLDGLGPEPYLFQELIEKQSDIRVTVVGSEAFAARIESQETESGRVDWRRAGADAVHSVEELPPEVAEKCVQMTRDYGLHFAAIDLVRRPDDGYVFLELNPNGQWAWVEQLTGLPLRARMAELLERNG
jgi:glutathione synthase/RimK-type ligase-like ATP-grasp enzyme